MICSLYRTISFLFCLVLALTCWPASIFASEQDTGTLVQTLYESGQSRYEQDQFVAAATLWNEALELLLQQDPEHPTTQMILLGIVDAYRQSSVRSITPQKDLEDAIRSIKAYRDALGNRAPSSEVVQAQSELGAKLEEMKERENSQGESGKSSASESTSQSLDADCTRNEQCSGQRVCLDGRCTRPIEAMGGRLGLSERMQRSGRWIIIAGGVVTATGLLMTILGVVKGNDLYRQYEADFDAALAGSKTVEQVDETYRIYQRYQGLYLSGFGVIGGGAVAIVSGAILFSFGKTMQQQSGSDSISRWGSNWMIAPSIEPAKQRFGLSIEAKF